MSSREAPSDSSTMAVANPARSLPAVQCHSTASPRSALSMISSTKRVYCAMANGSLTNLRYMSSMCWSTSDELMSSPRVSISMIRASLLLSRVMPARTSSMMGRCRFTAPAISGSGFSSRPTALRRSMILPMPSSPSLARSVSVASASWSERSILPLDTLRPSATAVPPRSRTL